MRLIYPKQMTAGQSQTLRLCVAKAGVEPAKDEVLSAVSAHLASIESGIQVIDQKFPVPKAGEIDLIAADRSGGLLLINISSSLDARVLAQFLMQADWMMENREVLEHFHFVNRESLIVNRENDKRSTINDQRDIRLWCIAGRVLPDAESILKRLGDVAKLEVFTYSCLELSGGRWLVVQSFLPALGGKRASPLPWGERDRYVLSEIEGVRGKGKALPPPDLPHQGGGIVQPSELTPEEIDDFFSDDEAAGICYSEGVCHSEPFDFAQDKLREESPEIDDNEITYVGPYFE